MATSALQKDVTNFRSWRDPVKQEKVRKINRFHVTQLACVLEKMKSIKEGEGTMLDNSMVRFRRWN